MSGTAPLTNAGVRFPPPFVYIAGLCLGWLLDRYVMMLPIPTTGDGIVWKIADLLIVAGILLSVWGIATFRSAQTSIIPNRSASRLVTSGPYRFTRNPMYTGLAMAYAGIALLIGSYWPFILLVVVLLIILRLVILPEERYLAQAFGAEYAGYCARVRRWV